MAYQDIVVIGSSYGGIEALQKLVSGLPPDYSGSIFIVNHVGAESPDILDQILEKAGPIPASNARDGEEFRPGRIYIARADYHLLLERSGHLRLTRGPKENRFRPAIDPLFRSAALAFGSRVVGVILTGLLDDGTAGLWAVKERRGTAVVQNPEEALADSMPLNALKQVEVDHCVSVKEIAPLLIRLARTPASEKGVQPMRDRMEAEVRIAGEKNALTAGVLQWGEPSIFSCPECHGVLQQLKEGTHLRFRCHTGHAYSLESLLAEVSGQAEEALWNAIRSLEESALLLRRMGTMLGGHGHQQSAAQLEARAQGALRRSEQIRALLLQPEAGSGRVMLEEKKQRQ